MDMLHINFLITFVFAELLWFVQLMSDVFMKLVKLMILISARKR